MLTNNICAYVDTDLMGDLDNWYTTDGAHYINGWFLEHPYAPVTGGINYPPQSGDSGNTDPGTGGNTDPDNP